jgi:hypothetical protein
MKLIPVTQKDAAGCGIACIAFVLKQSYDNTIGLLQVDPAIAKAKGLYCRDIVRIFLKAGYASEFHYLTQKWKRQIYQDGTIVFIGRSRFFPIGHYLCRWKGRWMDPWINYPSMSPVKAGWRKRLPGKAMYGIFVN